MRISDWSSDVCSSDLGTADRDDERLALGHVEGLPVVDFVLEEDHRVGVADRRLEKSLGIRGRIGRHDLEAGDMSVPAGIFLAVLGRDPGRSEEHTSELQSLMRLPYAGFCLKKKT